jgi:hypothetical protein
MRRTLAIVMLCLALPVVAQDAQPAGPAGLVAMSAAGKSLDEYQWSNRVIVVFADTPRDPAFTRQVELLAERPDALAEREIVVLTDTDPGANSAVRTALRPRGFTLVIVDKDGKVLFRKPSPWDVREIVRAIDKTPLRLQEMRDARDAEARKEGFSN